MDDSDPLADVMAELAAQKATLTKIMHMKETLQNEVAANEDELERLHSVKRETHTTQEETKHRTDYKYPLYRYVKQHLPWHKHGIHKYMTQRQCLCR